MQRLTSHQLELKAHLEILEVGYIALEKRLRDLEYKIFGKAGYNPNQPRVPAGDPDGGQWTMGKQDCQTKLDT